MQFEEADRDFLRTLVKTARQRPSHVKWVDRDGRARVTVLSAEEEARLEALARKAGVGKEALMREAAAMPAIRSPGGAGAAG